MHSENLTLKPIVYCTVNILRKRRDERRKEIGEKDFEEEK